jgi:hypothetical protein
MLRSRIKLQLGMVRAREHWLGSRKKAYPYELNQEQSPEKQASFQARMNESIEKLHAAQWLSLQGGENDG